jgi:hypothetical protein
VAHGGRDDKENQMRIALGTIAVLLLAALPVAAQKTQIDYDKTVDFGTYRSFAWFETRETSLEDASEMLHSSVRNAIESTFAASGITEVGKDEDPDVFITYHTNATEQVSYNTTDYGYDYGGGWYYGGGLGISTTTTHTYKRGSLIIDIWDAETKRLVWRGIASSAVPKDPENAAKKIDKVISKLAKQWDKKYRGALDEE